MVIVLIPRRLYREAAGWARVAGCSAAAFMMVRNIDFIIHTNAICDAIISWICGEASFQ